MNIQGKMNFSNYILGIIVPWSITVELPKSKNWEFIKCAGQELDRKKYHKLFKLIGTYYGAGDGKNTFNIPNSLHPMELRGIINIIKVV